MPLNVDAIVAQQYIDKLKDLVSRVPRGDDQEELCDDIMEFVEKMQIKYKNKR